MVEAHGGQVQGRFESAGDRHLNGVLSPTGRRGHEGKQESEEDHHW